MPYADPQKAKEYRRNRYLANRAAFIAQVSDARRRRKESARLKAIFSAAQLHPTERLLTAERFDADALKALATRQHYADSMKSLLRAARFHVESPIGAMLADQRFMAFRVAWACGAIHAIDSRRTIFGLEDLRAVARGRDSELRERARKALAVLGFINWRVSRRETRAAFLVGRLFEARP